MRPLARFSASLAICAALPLAPCLAGAQDVRPDTATLSPVVVTATRGATGMRTATASTTVLDGARLRAAGVRSVADVTPGGEPWGLDGEDLKGELPPAGIRVFLATMSETPAPVRERATSQA